MSMQLQSAVRRAAIRPRVPLRVRAAEGFNRVWRPAASFMALAFALMIGWHVVNGNNGLATWQQKRSEDQRLRQDINEIEQENARLRVRVQRLGTDAATITHEAREKLQYVGEDEVIFKLPPKPAENATTPAAQH